MRVDLYSVLPLYPSFAGVPPEGHAVRGEHDEKGLGLVLSRGSRNFGGENDVCLSPHEIFPEHCGCDDGTVHMRPAFGGTRRLRETFEFELLAAGFIQELARTKPKQLNNTLREWHWYFCCRSTCLVATRGCSLFEAIFSSTIPSHRGSFICST